MADSIVAQHNLTRNALPSSQVASRLINCATAALVFLLALGAFVLSYAALWEIALTYGLPARLAWIWPLLIDFALIVFSLAVVRASLRGERTFWPWLLVAIYTIATVTFNIIHAPNHLIAQIIAIVAPVSLFLSFETLMGMLKSEVKRSQTMLRLSELQAQLTEVQNRFNRQQAELERTMTQRQAEFDTMVQQQQAELDRLMSQIEEKRTQLADLISELKFTKKAAKNSAFDPQEGSHSKFIPGDLVALKRANQAKRANVDARRDRVRELLAQELGPTAIANELKIPISTIKRDIRALRAEPDQPTPTSGPVEPTSLSQPEISMEILHTGLNGQVRVTG